MTPELKRLVSILEAREQWLGGIGHTTTYDLIKRGELVKVNIGRRSFITVESLAAYVDRLSEVAAGGAAQMSPPGLTARPRPGGSSFAELDGGGDDAA